MILDFNHMLKKFSNFYREIAFIFALSSFGFFASSPLCDGNDHLICDARSRCRDGFVFVVELEHDAARDLEDLNFAREIIHEKGDVGACLDPEHANLFLKKTKEK